MQHACLTPLDQQRTPIIFVFDPSWKNTHPPVHHPRLSAQLQTCSSSSWLRLALDKAERIKPQKQATIYWMRYYKLSKADAQAGEGTGSSSREHAALASCVICKFVLSSDMLRYLQVRTFFGYISAKSNWMIFRLINASDPCWTIGPMSKWQQEFFPKPTE